MTFSLIDLLMYAVPGNLQATLFMGLFGTLIGSFLNVVIYRLPIMMERDAHNYVAAVQSKTIPHEDKFNLVAPRSCCPKCGHQISGIENIPVLSYLALRGKCRACRASIPARYPFIEIMTGILSALLIWHFGTGMRGFGALLFGYILMSLIFIDTDTHLLPDSLTLPLLWIGLFVNLNDIFAPLSQAVLGAIGGYGILWTFCWVLKLFTGKIGMGHGDFKLLAAMGAWIGLGMLPYILVVACAVASLVAIVYLLRARHHHDTPIPFGPYLALGGFGALIYGKEISHAYLLFV